MSDDAREPPIETVRQEDDAPLLQSMTPGAREGARRGKPTAAQSAAITTVIIEAATALFMQLGFDGTTMDAVAARVGIPRKTLYKRFADKGELLEAVLRARVASWSLVTSKQNAKLTDDVGQRLKQYVTTVLIWSTSAEVRAFTKLFASADGLPGESRRRHDFYGQSELIDIMARDIATYGPLKNIHATDARRTARLLMALVTGWLDMREERAIGPDEAVQEAALLVDTLLLGSKAW